MTTQISRLIDIKGLQILIGLGLTATYGMTKDPTFPEPFSISSKCLRWEEAEVRTWLETRRGRKSSARRIPSCKGKTFDFEGTTFRAGPSESLLRVVCETLDLSESRYKFSLASISWLILVTSLSFTDFEL